jgi:glycosyltransferase involved in cell wall biosynthesis
MRKVPSLTIAIPAYNESGSIKKVVTEALAAAQALAITSEILVVDDGSTDGTGRILDTLGTIHPALRVIHHPKNQGFSGAIKSCYKHAEHELIFLLPADGQIKAQDCELFLNKLGNADVVVGFRKHNPESWSRKLNSKVFHALYRLLFGVKLKEISTSILWRKKILNRINITAIPRSALIEPEVVYKAWKSGARFEEVAVPYYARASGKAKGSNPFMILMTIRELVRLWLTCRVLQKK